VCRACERWNLSPLEERLEIIDDCERLFSETRMRVSTENIGLARLSEGLELVRIGRPMRPEFAAWRYGDQFGRRRRRMFIRAGVGIGAVGILATGAAVAGVAMGGFFQFGGQLWRPLIYGSDNKIIARISADGTRHEIRRGYLRRVKLVAGEGDSWQLEVPTRKKLKPWQLEMPNTSNKLVLSGEEAHNAAKLLLPHVNTGGGNAKQVSTAVNLLDLAGDPMYYVASVARNPQRGSNQRVIGTRRNRNTIGIPISSMSAEVRLALEMATHEEAERRALEGELKALEIAWKEADEVAAISDNLFLPTFITDAIERFKK
jgi:hypothetical protein